MHETEKTIVSRTLTESETTRWESDDAPTREAFRRAVRFGMDCNYTIRGTSIEIYSHDGITLDAWERSSWQANRSMSLSLRFNSFRTTRRSQTSSGSS